MTSEAPEIALRAAGALSAQLSVPADATVGDLRALIAQRLGIGPADAAALKMICGGTRLQASREAFQLLSCECPSHARGPHPSGVFMQEDGKRLSELRVSPGATLLVTRGAAVRVSALHINLAPGASVSHALSSPERLITPAWRDASRSTCLQSQAPRCARRETLVSTTSGPRVCLPPFHTQAAAPLAQQQERVDAEEAAKARLERIKNAASALAGRGRALHPIPRVSLSSVVPRLLPSLLPLTDIRGPASPPLRPSVRSEDDFTDSRYAPQLCNQDGTEMRLPEADRRALVLGLLLHTRGRALLDQASAFSPIRNETTASGVGCQRVDG